MGGGQGIEMAETDGLPPPQRYWSIAMIWVGMVMAVLDSSIANVALPTLAHQLNTTAAASIWVINAYQLGMVMLLLPLAACGEMLGYRRIYMTGMAVFTLASAVCIFAPSLVVLAIGRGLQGMGAAGIMSMNAALVRHTYPRRQIGRALGGNAFIVGVSTAAAPTVASTILSVASWRWLFAVNIPFCVFVLALGVFVLPRSEAISWAQKEAVEVAMDRPNSGMRIRSLGNRGALWPQPRRTTSTAQAADSASSPQPRATSTPRLTRSAPNTRAPNRVAERTALTAS